jgi:hypothetical protein
MRTTERPDGRAFRRGQRPAPSAPPYAVASRSAGSFGVRWLQETRRSGIPAGSETRAERAALRRRFAVGGVLWSAVACRRCHHLRQREQAPALHSGLRAGQARSSSIRSLCILDN